MLERWLGHDAGQRYRRRECEAVDGHIQTVFELATVEGWRVPEDVRLPLRLARQDRRMPWCRQKEALVTVKVVHV